MINNFKKRKETNSKNIVYEQNNFIKKVTDSDGNIMFVNIKGQLHSFNDQPAVIKSDGTKEWYQNDQKHREKDKPAVEHNSGAKEWWQNGKRHRDGDKPAVIDDIGNVFFFKNNKRHRDGGKPAVIAADGRKKWYQNGKPVSGGIDLLDMKEPNIFYSIWFSLTNRSRIKKYL